MNGVEGVPIALWRLELGKWRRFMAFCCHRPFWGRTYAASIGVGSQLGLWVGVGFFWDVGVHFPFGFRDRSIFLWKIGPVPLAVNHLSRTQGG